MRNYIYISNVIYVLYFPQKLFKKFIKNGNSKKKKRDIKKKLKLNKKINKKKTDMKKKKKITIKCYLFFCSVVKCVKDKTFFILVNVENCIHCAMILEYLS